MTHRDDDLVAAILTLGTLRGETLSPDAAVDRFAALRDALERLRAADEARESEAWDRQHGVGTPRPADLRRR